MWLLILDIIQYCITLLVVILRAKEENTSVYDSRECETKTVAEPPVWQGMAATTPAARGSQ